MPRREGDGVPHELLKTVLSIEEEADLIVQTAHDQASRIYSEARTKAHEAAQAKEREAEEQAERIRAEEHGLAEQELTAAKAREKDAIRHLTATGRERLPDAVAEAVNYLREKA